MIIQHEYVEYDCCDKYSLKVFTGHDMREEDLSNRIIYGSSFYKEQPDSEIFSPTMRGVTFINCNLDNLIIPEGNTFIGCSQLRFEAQSDGRDWLLDDDYIPVRVVDYAVYEKNGIPEPCAEDLI